MRNISSTTSPSATDDSLLTVVAVSVRFDSLQYTRFIHGRVAITWNQQHVSDASMYGYTAIATVVDWTVQNLFPSTEIVYCITLRNL